MPARHLAAKELGALLSVLAHPARLQIVEELGLRELDVRALADTLGLSQPGVSQHLGLLRAHRLVSERREGRRVFYRLRRPELAAWLLEGLGFLAEPLASVEDRRQLMNAARATWSGEVRDG
ncbi:MAG: metalloregulator ArsR/SmtB family transcription factor [Candidatus Sericytochromatia bacterium]|nr:metalloregulator ArsR/SmtB family transcription factor [Candidatus Sericytochromatia bacterium]MEB3221353.1 metalloregulator ArsR/SmtB family transcription factor [Candidatus Sericytochromatia bacterium]